MPTSKKRGGKKTHNKRVTKRNKNIANAQRAYEKLYNNALQAHLEKLNQNMLCVKKDIFGLLKSQRVLCLQFYRIYLMLVPIPGNKLKLFTK